MIKYEKPQLIDLSEEIMTLGACPSGDVASGGGIGVCTGNGTTATGTVQQACKSLGVTATGPTPACKNGQTATLGCNTGSFP